MNNGEKKTKNVITFLDLCGSILIIMRMHFCKFTIASGRIFPFRIGNHNYIQLEN